MGCDGGTIPRRDELVKTKKRPESKDKDSDLNYKWRHCAITQQNLQSPIVTCGLGRLYNKIALIETLLNKNNPLPECAKHIRTLKDVRDLNLTENPAYKENTSKEEAVNNRAAPFICPVIGLEMAGTFRFVALWSCGCVFSERALKELKSTTCHKCFKPFSETDVVILNGNEEDLKLMQQRLEVRQKSKKSKSKSNEKTDLQLNASTSIPNDEIKSTINDETVQKIGSSTIINKAGLLKREIKQKSQNGNGKKLKIDYSVAKDPKVTDVYKSLFTSHKSEKEQDRAHWITYNPFYN